MKSPNCFLSEMWHTYDCLNLSDTKAYKGFVKTHIKLSI